MHLGCVGLPTPCLQGVVVRALCIFDLLHLGEHFPRTDLVSRATEQPPKLVIGRTEIRVLLNKLGEG